MPTSRCEKYELLLFIYFDLWITLLNSTTRIIYFHTISIILNGSIESFIDRSTNLKYALANSADTVEGKLRYSHYQLMQSWNINAVIL